MPESEVQAVGRVGVLSPLLLCALLLSAPQRQQGAESEVQVVGRVGVLSPLLPSAPQRARCRLFVFLAPPLPLARYPSPPLFLCHIRAI